MDKASQFWADHWAKETARILRMNNAIYAERIALEAATTPEERQAARDKCMAELTACTNFIRKDAA
jgi:hypothetical protein